jgi:ribosomal protein S18 acetylase RimI-like enzyme
MELYTVQPTDGKMLRELMLRMYADSPDAFGETLAQAQARSDKGWDELAEMVADPSRWVAFVARQDDQSVGFVVGLVGRAINGQLDHSFTETVTVGRMWVDPTLRGQGLAHTLMDAVMSWAQQKGAKQIELEVTEGNDRAIRFYEQSGFVDTGHREPFPSNPQLQIYFMVRNL